MADSYVCSGAMMRCTMGSSPAKLTVLPSRTVFLAGQPQANISDHKSMVNLAPFGVCRSLAFPPTAAATAAAHGHLTPMPCVHNTPAPWFVGKTDTLIKGQPALLQSCKCQCMWGGTISLINNGQVAIGAEGVQNEGKQSFGKGHDSDLMAADVSQLWQNLVEKLGSIQAAKEAAKEAERNQSLIGLSNLLASNTGWFVNPGGFQNLQVNEPGYDDYNGYTRLDGNIYLKEDLMNDCLDAFTKIQNKKKLSKQEEQSLATLWHEINHNMHNTQYDSGWELTGNNSDYMELANEFVARKTLPDFYNALGVKMRYTQFMSNRKNTRYNPWVVKYQKAIKKFDLDESVVLNTVKEGLYNGDYHNQRENLKNALVEGGKYIDNKTKTPHQKITEEQAIKVVDELLSDQISWTDFLMSLFS